MSYNDNALLFRYDDIYFCKYGKNINGECEAGDNEDDDDNNRIAYSPDCKKLKNYFDCGSKYLDKKDDCSLKKKIQLR